MHQHPSEFLAMEQHQQDVERVKKDICSGRIFQCEVGFKSSYEIEGNPLRLYEKLRSYNPSPHMYYFKFTQVKDRAKGIT